MTPRKLTDAVVKQLTSASKTFIVWDEDVKGFGCRVTANRKAFVFNYRTKGGRQRQQTIGSIPAWSTSMAREEAKRLKRLVEQGGDPMGDLHERRAAPTMNELADLYRENHMPRKRSAKGDEAMLVNDVLPKLGRDKVADIQRADIAKLHRAIGQRAPYVANRTLALLSKMFSLAIAERWRSDNPAKGIERYPEEKRERYLNEDERYRLKEALRRHPGQNADAIELLVLTGSRKMEVLKAEWSQFDLDHGDWVKPAAATKQKKIHRVPLDPVALELLRRMRREAEERIAASKAMGRIARVEPFLFPGVKRGQPQTSLGRFWAVICADAGLSDFRIHDLRHTFASTLVSEGESLPMIGALLGHTQVSTTQRYAHIQNQAARKAVSRVGEAWRNAKPRVVPLRLAD